MGARSSCTAPPRRRPEWLIFHPNSRWTIRRASAFRSPAVRSTSSRSTANGADEHVGELVYHGPNVMMGYATRPARPCARQALSTRYAPATSRADTPTDSTKWSRAASRFVKMYGLRIDLQRVEDTLRERGVTAICTDGDGRLLVAAARAARRLRRARAVGRRPPGCPRAAVRVVDVDEIPLLPTGKPDYQAVRDAVRAVGIRGPPTARPTLPCSPTCCISIPASIDPDCSFVDLGGNSLSYVTMSVRLERAIGHLPVGLAADAVARATGHRVGRDGGGARRWRPASRCGPWPIVLVVVSHAEL